MTLLAHWGVNPPYRRRPQMEAVQTNVRPMDRPKQSLEREVAVRVARVALASQEPLSVADGQALARQLLRALALPE